jgi:hypothetical protein
VLEVLVVSRDHRLTPDEEFSEEFQEAWAFRGSISPEQILSMRRIKASRKILAAAEMRLDEAIREAQDGYDEARGIGTEYKSG